MTERREAEGQEPGPVIDDPEQYQRFVEAAKEMGADNPEAGETFERALRRVLPPREPGKPAFRREGWPKPEGNRGRKRKL
jgi:hypothetical protein